ncbi:outer membrane protein TolC, partial [Paraburkholderia sp. WSM4177]|nr:outer membrane protein TolC [Paraburkholderia sp. WSM4177]MBB5488708.1 outer membrane protein TolC [Paraburkholderia sp. WSM4180]
VQQQRNALATFQAAVPALQQQLDTNIHALAVPAGTAPEQFTVSDAALADIPITVLRQLRHTALMRTDRSGHTFRGTWSSQVPEM